MKEFTSKRRLKTGVARKQNENWFWRARVVEVKGYGGGILEGLVLPR